MITVSKNRLNKYNENRANRAKFILNRFSVSSVGNMFLEKSFYRGAKVCASQKAKELQAVKVRVGPL